MSFENHEDYPGKDTVAKPEQKSNRMLGGIQIPICNCCSIILGDGYHVMKGLKYCDRCYVSSHHIHQPEICPFISAIRKVMRLFQAVELDEREADEIKKFIDSRVRRPANG